MRYHVIAKRSYGEADSHRVWSGICSVRELFETVALFDRQRIRTLLRFRAPTPQAVSVFALARPPPPPVDSVVRMLRCFTTWSPCPRFMWPPCPFVFVSPIATFWLESSSWFPHKIQNQRRSWYRSITIEIMIPFLSWRLSTLLFLNPLYHFSLLCLVWIILSRISSICGLDLMHSLTPIL